MEIRTCIGCLFNYGLTFQVKSQLTVGNQYGFLMAPINLAVFDITCKQIERIIRKLFCLVTKEIK